MFRSFITSYRLKNTYRVNSIIYALKHTPIIKKILPYSLYTSRGLKIFANIISSIIEVISTFIGQLTYFIFMYMIFINLYKNQSLAFLNIFVFLTVIGGFTNTYLFNPSVDKFYAINLMGFEARKYTLSNYIYSIIKCLIGFLPFTIIFGSSVKLPILVTLIMPIFVVSVKNIVNVYSLIDFKKDHVVKNENKALMGAIAIGTVLMSLGYGLPVYNIGITVTIFYAISAIVFVLGAISFRYIIKFDKYTKLCKEMLKDNQNFPDKAAVNLQSFNNSITKTEIAKTDKKGYAYFNYIFTMRHKKLLTNATKYISIGIVVFFAVCEIALVFFPVYNKEANGILKNSMPYFLFVMYFINRGQRICQTMFMNCDRSMLTYRFYREKNAILSLFKERLKTLIMLNIVPGILIAIGVNMLLFTTGGASTIEYIMGPLSIIAMSIFFSVHYLVLYYLLQPYDVNLEVKNPTFMGVCSLTYFVCYMATKITVPTIVFGAGMCLFTIIYTLLSLYLAYKYAPSKFKLRV